MVGTSRDLVSSSLLRRVERRVVLRGVIATITTIAPLSIGAAIAATEVVPRTHVRSLNLLLAVVLPVLFGCGLTIYAVSAPRAIRRAIDRSGERAQSTEQERRPITGLAWRMMIALALPWIAGEIALIPVGLSVPYTTWVMVPLGFIGIAIAGAVTIALAYVLVDDALRPLYAVALADPDVQPGRSVGLLRRFGLYWLVGSGLNLFATALVLFLLPGSGRRIAIVFCAFGAPVGGALTIFAARSVTGRVEGLLENVERVEGGDLGTAADVDDLGEIGRLQRGFNRMVAGLRERERLGDLFGRHVGRDVALRALGGRGLEGSERTVSVLFIDVIGSTTLAADRPPREVVTMLNGLFDGVVRATAAEGGLVNQFQGDGALCVFGAPLDTPDHAARALRAAKALSREIAMLRRTYPGFDAAIGVSTGDVVAGDIGNEDRYQYTVIGDPVNEASRLCDEAKSRESRVLVSGTSIAAASSDGWAARGEVVLRGRPSPTPVFEPR